jgi:hypothetical protein
VPASTFGGENFQAAIHFMAGFPQGEFKDNVDNNALGIDGYVLYSPARSPLATGISLVFANYGEETRTEPFSPTVPEVLVDVTTSNEVFQGHLMLRMQHKQGVVQPYADGLFGFNYFVTETTIRNQSSDEEVAGNTNLDDAVLSYGAGGGVQFRLWWGAVQQQPSSVLIDVGVRYLYGRDAEYLKEGSIRREDGQVVFDVIKSRTNMFTLHVGIALTF